MYFFKKLTIMFLIICLSIYIAMSIGSTSCEVLDRCTDSISKKEVTIIELTGAAAAISTAITLIPDDVATPIAEKIADTSTYFIIILCILIFEKYMLSIGMQLAFGILIPLCCILYLHLKFTKTQGQLFKSLFNKARIFALSLILIVPLSISISGFIELTFNDSIQEAIDAAMNGTKEIEECVDEEEDKGFLEGIWNKISGGVTGFTERAQTLLSKFVEAVAVLLVTNCIIPIIVALVFMGLFKSLFNTDRDIRYIPIIPTENKPNE